jgi:hypothetical protein
MAAAAATAVLSLLLLLLLLLLLWRTCRESSMAMSGVSERILKGYLSE